MTKQVSFYDSTTGSPFKYYTTTFFPAIKIQTPKKLLFLQFHIIIAGAIELVLLLPTISLVIGASKRLQDILTMDFSTPGYSSLEIFIHGLFHPQDQKELFNPRLINNKLLYRKLFNPGLFNHETQRYFTTSYFLFPDFPNPKFSGINFSTMNQRDEKSYNPKTHD